MKLKTKLFMAGIAAAGMLIFAADNVSYAANGWQTSGNSWIYTEESFLHSVKYLMVGGDQVGVGGDPQPGGVGAAAGEPINFSKQGFEINDHTIAKNGCQ